MPSNGTKSPKTSDSDANAKENVSSKASKQPVFQVINTMDESSSDNPVTTSKSLHLLLSTLARLK